ncbi:MAG: Ig-like domain-containing protein [Pyrinomonadaceae bacterium]
MNTHTRQCAAILFVALPVCLWVASVRSQQGGATLRRITSTAERGLNLNPTLSGDGRRIAFESTENLADTGGSSGFRALLVDLTDENFRFMQVAASRAPAPALSHDGMRVAFASRENLTGENPDGNSEIFLFDGALLQQLTRTSPVDEAQRIGEGNFQPSISDNGQLIAFASNRDLTGANRDANREIFIYDADTRAFSQITDTRDMAGASDAKISGDGTRIVFLRDNGAMGDPASTTRDLLLYERATSSTRVIESEINNLTFTYGRAMSDDGERVVYAAQTATNTTQVFLFDGRNNVRRQITTLGSRAADVALHPSISGDGSRLTFATRRSVAGLGSTDGGVELYLYDLPTNRFSRITNAPATATAEVVSSLNDEGSLVAFNFPRVLSGEVSESEFANNAEIYLANLAARAPFSSNLRVLHGASFGREPSSMKALAPNQIAIATGANLALTPVQAKPLADGSFPLSLGGVTLNVNGRPAQLFYVSPTQINFLVPAEIETGTAQVSARNHDGHESRASITILTAAPGVFTEKGDGRGAAIALDAQTLLRSPFAPVDASNNVRRLAIFATGVRNASNVSVTLGGRELTVETITPSPDLPGLEQINVALHRSLTGAGSVPLIVRADGRASNTTMIDIGGMLRAATISLEPSMLSIDIGRSVRFVAAVRDAEGVEIANAPIIFSSTDPNIAIIDAAGNARGLNAGAVTITATTGELSATAQLSVRPLSLVINEALADPPEGVAGDANRDGARSSTQDEFIEIVNAAPVDIDLGGYQLTTRSGNGADTVRHTFASGTVVAPGTALVVFGGAQPAAFNPADPLFAGALILTASTGGLSLTNSGSTVRLLDPSGAIIEEFVYGGSSDLDGDRNQSLTRAPDILGDFVRHTTISGVDARPFSPGTRNDGMPFGVSSPIARIEVAPASATISAGARQQFTARAFDASHNELQGVVFRWHSSDPTIAAIDPNGTAYAIAPGTAEITATARGTQSAPAALSVNAPPAVTRVEVTPTTPSINRGGTIQFGARAFDQNGSVVDTASFSWSTTNAAIATVSAQGLARGSGIGAVIITASTFDNTGGMVTGQAALEVRIPLTLNEILADVPPDNTATNNIEGDANRDGVRNSDDDEFIELFNHSTAMIDLSGLILADTTANRYTFPANTMLAPGRAAVVFGGGTPPPSDPAFGGALVFRASSLGLNDAGDTVTLKVRVTDTEIVVVSQSYGTAAAAGGPPAPSNQSLTRSFDAAVDSAGGSFIGHSLATNAASRVFSPGTRADGTPFGSPSISRISIDPATSAIDIGATQIFNARAYTRLEGGEESEVANVSFIWDSSNAGKATIAPSTGRSTTAQAVSAGSTDIHARAGGFESTATLIVNPPPPLLTRLVLSPSFATATVGGTQQFEAQALDQYDQPFPVSSITFASDNVAAATIDSITHRQGASDATAIVRGRGAGTAHITATATNDVSQESVVSNSATLNVTPPPPSITRIEVAPLSATIGAGATQQFTAKAFDQHDQEIAGVTFIWATSRASVASIEQNGLATGHNAGTTDVTASSAGVTSQPATLNVAAPTVPSAGQVIINEALISFATSSTQARNDFVEIYNPTNQTLDISGLMLTFRPSGAGNTPQSITLPGAIGSGSVLLTPQNYFLIVNGAETFGVPADFDARLAGGFDLNNTTGAVKLEIGGTKLDGLTYQGGSTPPAAPFNTFGEGTILPFTGGSTNDLIRSPNAVDTNNNATDFRRNGTASSVSPKRANP